MAYERRMHDAFVNGSCRGEQCDQEGRWQGGDQTVSGEAGLCCRQQCDGDFRSGGQYHREHQGIQSCHRKRYGE